MSTPEWDAWVDLHCVLAECKPKKGSLRAYLIPELVRLGARLVETRQNETFVGVHETWEIETGAGRLEICPQDAYRQKVPGIGGRRGRCSAHIHSRFDNNDLFAEWQGIDERKYTTGKWNWYEFDFDDPADLGPHFIAMLERVITWQPTAAHMAGAARRRAAYEGRWAVKIKKVGGAA